jgi:hypothetical protein
MSLTNEQIEELRDAIRDLIGESHQAFAATTSNLGGELKTEMALMKQSMEGLKSLLVEILDHAKETNGRVTELEKYNERARGYSAGAAALLVIVISLVSYIFITATNHLSAKEAETYTLLTNHINAKN